MKRIIASTIWLVFLAWSLSFGQSNDQTVIYKYTSGAGTYTQIINRAYTTATIDTSVWYTTSLWSIFQVYVQSQDSASCIVKFQTSYNKDSVGVVTTRDSLKTTSNAGDGKTVDLSAYVGAAPYFRVVLAFNSGVAQGVTSAKYTAYLSRKRY